VRLIDDLLDVSRVTSGRVQLQSEIVDVRQVLRDTIDAMQPRISELNHSLTTDMPYDPLYVVGDAVRLGQVFGNLLANAAKYMDPGGCIEVTAQTRHGDDRRVEISVIDAGTGLDASMLDYVFELFAQAQPVGSHAESGLGIGLALVRELVELHGGSVRAESDGPGCGSRFIVELPLTDQLPVAAGATGSKPRTSPARLLVIDDNVDAASALAFLLERISGHEVQVAGDAERGIHAAVESKPDVIFLDIGLPDLNGCEVARRLRDILGGECGHLVAITGFGTGQTAVSHDDAAFDCILTKPVAYAELERLLGRITGASGQPGMTPGVDSQPAMGCRPASQLASPLS
jgi:CheY-like chemotaxis protein/two-component sensor histidine kinase